ncbi:MAG: hypothetical protein HY671_08720, partial [Chloroflexi bacterium]|nr:hypothetical protein [Chloroflexota bacterium]
TWFWFVPAPFLDAAVSVAATQVRDVQWVSHNTPSTVKPGEQVNVSLTVANTGSLTWPKGGANPVVVSYHWLNAATGAAVVWDGLRSALPGDVASGETATVTATLKAPPAAGSYTLRWDLVQEGITWFWFVPAPFLDAAVSVAAAQAKDVQWVSYETTTAIKPGQMVGVPITLTNIGSQTWVKGGANPVYVTYHWLNASWQAVEWGMGLRSSLPQDVASGQTVSIVASLKAPAAAGSYNLVWDVVQEGIAWFSGQGAPQAVASGVSVAAAQAKDVQWVSHNTPASLTPGQQVSVSLMLTNTGSQTWVNGGPNPVNISYHWLDSATGAAVVWDGLRSPLPQDIVSGQLITVNASLKAPLTAGNYTLVWDLVQEGVTWFWFIPAPALGAQVTVAP